MLANLSFEFFVTLAQTKIRNMKKIITMSFIAIALFGLYSFIGEGEKYATIEIGTKAPLPGYMMNSTAGDQYNLTTLAKPNGLLVVFSCNTCPFVLAWEDRYPELFDKADQMQIGVALVNSNEAKRGGEDSSIEMEKHARENGYENIPYLVDKDSQLANAFGAKTTPHVFLF